MPERVTSKPGLHDHLGRQWSGTIVPNVRTSLQQRKRQSLSGAARQDRVPSEQPRQPRASAKRWRFMLRLRLGKEVGGDQRRPVSQANTTSLALPWRPVTLDTSTLFVGGHATEPVHPQLGCALFQRRNESGVQGVALRGTMAIRPPQLSGDERPPCLVAQGPNPSHVRRDPCSCFADTFQSECPATQHARQRKMPGGGQEGREDGHTERSEMGEKGLPDTSQEWDAKKRRVEPRVRCRGKAHERDANKGATSGTEKCVLPTVSQLTWFPNVPLIRQRTRTCCQIFSRRWMETMKLQEFH